MYGSSYMFRHYIPNAFWEMLKWGAVDRILWMGVLCLVTWVRTTSLDTTLVVLDLYQFNSSYLQGLNDNSN
jgi:hypothetical protein